jgi:hypothetical protein
MRCNHQVKRTVRGVTAARWPVVCFLLTLLVAAPLAVATADDSFDADRQRLENMPAEEKEELLRKKERFDRLSPEEQDRLRQLHSQISSDPQSQRLHELMVRYTEWLKTLSSGQRAELLALPAEQRVARIQALIKEQETQRFGRLVEGQLPPQDLEVIYKWLERYVEAHEAELLQKMPPEIADRFRQMDDPEKRRRALIFSLQFRRPSDDFAPAQPEEINQLVNQLSAEAKRILKEAQSNPERRASLVAQWSRAAAFSKFRQPVEKNELERFVTTELSAADRERLEGLPPDRMHSELQRLYYFYHFKNETAPSWGPWVRRPGDHDGGPRFGPGGGRGQGSGSGPNRGGGPGSPPPRPGEKRGPSPNAPGPPPAAN